MLPTRKEIAFFYKTHRRSFEAPERIRALQITKNIDELCDATEAMAAMLEAKTELEKGRSFAEAAERYSDCKGGGGELGWIARGAMVEEFETVVFALAPGHRTDIFETRFGLHIVEVVEHMPPGIRPLREVSEMIKQHLIEQQDAKRVGR